MSKFLKALEQAERDRALRDQRPASDARPAEPAPRLEELHGETHAEPVDESVEPLEHVDEHLVALLTPTSFEAEQYLTLRHAVEQAHRTRGVAVIAVSSPGKGDGKTLTAINLAGALAQAPENRVLLVDADLREAAISNRLDLNGDKPRGLVGAILDPAMALEDVVQPRRPFNFSVLPAGRRPPGPYEVLKSPRLGELLAAARERYDFIVLDTPPLIPFADCLAIAKWTDGVLLVVSAHRTSRRLLAEALHVVDPAKLVGLVWNNDDDARARYPYAYTRGAEDGSTPRQRLN